MTKTEYQLNPYELLKNNSYSGLNFTQKSIYKAILDFLWMEESQCSCIYDLDVISQKIGVEKEAVDEVLSLLDCGDSALLTLRFCFENGMIVESTDLKRQIEDFKQELAEHEKLVDELNKKQKKSTLLSRVSSTYDEDELIVAYIKKSEQNLELYDGWLPTINFKRNGQVYLVRKPFVDSLIEKYPSIDVKKEIENIFIWLSKNEGKRRTSARMNKMIDEWISRASTMPRNEKTNISDIENAINQMSLSMMTEMAH